MRTFQGWTDSQTRIQAMINKSRNAFEDVVAAFERAINAPNGIRVVCATHSEAMRLRQRFNYYRKMDRSANREIYTKDNPMYGMSVYDRLELRITKKGDLDDHILYIEPRSVIKMKIEDIEDDITKI